MIWMTALFPRQAAPIRLTCVGAQPTLASSSVTTVVETGAAEPSAPTRLEPLPHDMLVERGRDAYLRENGFTLEAYSAKWTPASLFGIPFSVPNTARHKWAIKLHDLHHVATGYGTDLAGECEISAWEARRGIRALGLYVASIVLSLALSGLLIAPRRTLRAWRASGSGHSSLFHGDYQSDATYLELLQLPIAELRARLGVPRHGVAVTPRGLNSRAPSR